MDAVDLRVRGGLVVDPDAGTQTLTDVWIDDGVVHAVGSGDGLAARAEIDAAGLVVGPGFVDLHSHVNSIAGQRLQAMDGVTTALDLESGLMPLEVAYRRSAAEGRPLNYGYSASWGGARAKILAGIEPDASLLQMLPVLDNPSWQRTSSPQELDAWLALLERELDAGSLGIGVLMGYAPQSDPREFLAVASLAARHRAPVFSHVRELVESDPRTPIDGSEEIVRAADLTGAAMHHCHVNSTSRRHVDRVLGTLERARAAGSRISLEAYPYGAGSTAIGAYFLDPDRISRWGIAPRNLIMLSTGRRVEDEAQLAHLRRTDPGAPCIVEFLDEQSPADAALVLRSLEHPGAIVASDAMPVLWDDGTSESRQWPLPAGGRTHPRTAGTYSKTLRLMVREHGAWSWVEAFRRCSYLPSRVLDEIAPSMRLRGRLEPGAAADIVMIDPDRVSDLATFTDPTRPSIGVRHLLVNGHPVVRDGELDVDAYPGRAVRGEAA